MQVALFLGRLDFIKTFSNAANEPKSLRMQISMAKNPASLQNRSYNPNHLWFVCSHRGLTLPVRLFRAPDQFYLSEMWLTLESVTICGSLSLRSICSVLRWIKASTVQQMVLTAALGSMRRCCRTLASSQRPDTHRRSNSHSSRPSTLASAHTPPTAPRHPDHNTELKIDIINWTFFLQWNMFLTLKRTTSQHPFRVI